MTAGLAAHARKTERMPDSSYVEHKSELPFSRTVDHLIETIEAVGMNIFAKIDHAAGATEVASDRMRPAEARCA